MTNGWQEIYSFSELEKVINTLGMNRVVHYLATKEPSKGDFGEVINDLSTAERHFSVSDNGLRYFVKSINNDGSPYSALAEALNGGEIFDCIKNASRQCGLPWDLMTVYNIFCLNNSFEKSTVSERRQWLSAFKKQRHEATNKLNKHQLAHASRIETHLASLIEADNT